MVSQKKEKRKKKRKKECLKYDKASEKKEVGK